MSERATTSKVTLMPFPRSEAKSSTEGVLLHRTRHRKLVPENDIWYQFHSGLSSVASIAICLLAEA